MLLVKSLPFGFDDLRGTIMDFEKAGDFLEKHVDTSFNNHITIVIRGKIKAFSHDWEVVAEAGQILDFKPYQPHEFEALEDNTRIININKKARPVDPDKEKRSDDFIVVPDSRV